MCALLHIAYYVSALIVITEDNLGPGLSTVINLTTESGTVDFLESITSKIPSGSSAYGPSSTT